MALNDGLCSMSAIFSRERIEQKYVSRGHSLQEEIDKIVVLFIYLLNNL